MDFFIIRSVLVYSYDHIFTGLCGYLMSLLHINFEYIRITHNFFHILWITPCPFAFFLLCRDFPLCISPFIHVIHSAFRRVWLLRINSLSTNQLCLLFRYPPLVSQAFYAFFSGTDFMILSSLRIVTRKFGCGYFFPMLLWISVYLLWIYCDYTFSAPL